MLSLRAGWTMGNSTTALYPIDFCKKKQEKAYSTNHVKIPKDFRIDECEVKMHVLSLLSTQVCEYSAIQGYIPQRRPTSVMTEPT